MKGFLVIRKFGGTLERRLLLLRCERPLYEDTAERPARLNLFLLLLVVLFFSHHLDRVKLLVCKLRIYTGKVLTDH